MNPNLLKQIEDRYANRKKAKSDFDRVITLSVTGEKDQKSFKLAVKSKDQVARLLDEGVVVDANGFPLFYIKRGSIEQWFNDLPEDYVGSINLGHMDHPTFPIILGTWSKSDLSVVDIGDGRKGLDVKLKLNEDLNIVKDLRAVGYPLGVSAEFYYDIDYKNSELLQLEVLESIDIRDFAIVGEAGNANSGGINLKGETGMKDKNFMENLFSKYLGVGKKDTDDKGKKDEEENTDEPQVTDPEGGADEATEEQLLEFATKFETLMDEHEKALEVISHMSDELDKTKAELAEASKQLSTYEKNVPTAFSKLKELSAKVGITQTADEDKKDKKEQSVSELSEDGWGNL